MRVLIWCILMCWGWQALGQEIVRGEYFIDIDPGLGMATPIVFNTPADTVEQTFEFDTQGLAPGHHTLVVRVQDSEGNWSISKYGRFYIEPPYTVPEPAQIAAAEFFIDNDPGVGNAFPVGGIAPADSILADAEHNIGALAPGMHTLGIRVQNALGNWSLHKYFRFMVEDYVPEEPDTANIIAVEYFLNSEDPGIGSATALPVDTPGQTVTVMDSLDMVAEALAVGRHQFLVRVKDSRGRWSLTNIQPFDYCTPEGVTANFDYNLNDNEISFIDLSKNAVDYRWKMGNGDVLTDSVPIYIYPQGGIYDVCQIIWNRCDIDTFCQTITVPTPMIVDSIQDFSILEDMPETIIVADLNTVFDDLDGDPLTFEVESDTSLIPATLLNGISFAMAATDDYVRTVGVNITATGGGVSVTQRIRVTVLPLNDEPYIEQPIPDVAYDEDSGPRIVVHRLEEYIKDPDDKRYRYFDRDSWRWRSNRLDFTAVSDDPGIEPEIVHNDSLILHLGQDYHGVANVTVTATDDSLATVEHTFQVTVLPLEDAPRLLKPIADVTIQEDAGTYLVDELTNIFLEPDGQNLNYQVRTDTNAVRLSISGNELLLETDANFHGSTKGIITANDAVQATTDTFNITVLPVNDAPTFTGLADLTLCPEGTSRILVSGTYSDVESNTDALVIGAAVVASSNPSVNKNALQLQWEGDSALVLSTTATLPTVFSLMMTATDPQHTGRDTVLVTLAGAQITVSGDTLIANQGNSYQWYKNGEPIANATQRRYLGKSAGSYQVAVTSGHCSALSDPVTITGLADLELSENTLVYPNPSSGLFHCYLKTSYGGAVYFRLTDLVGKTMWQQTMEKQALEMDVPMNLQHLPKGVFLLEIKTERGSLVKRLVKE